MTVQEEREAHSHALRELREQDGLEGMYAVLRVYARSFPVIHERIRHTVMHVETGISPLALARFVIEYQIIVQIRKCDEKLTGIMYTTYDREDISLVA